MIMFLLNFISCYNFMHLLHLVLCAVCADVVLKDRCSDNFIYYNLEDLNSSINFVWLFCDLFQLLSGEMDVFNHLLALLRVVLSVIDGFITSHIICSCNCLQKYYIKCITLNANEQKHLLENKEIWICL